MLKEKIEALYERQTPAPAAEFAPLFADFLAQLNSGSIRAAEMHNGQWNANAWVKKGILLGFRYGAMVDYSIDARFTFYDKHTYPPKSIALADQIRVVPGGTTARSGSYIAPGVVIMPPSYINVGAYVGANSMIDSHALVGSCAQIGSRVHLSAAAQIGGVLEPIGAMPVIIEDDVLVGGNCGVYEGTIVKKGAVLGAGTVLTRSIPVYDLVHEVILRAGGENSLIIPENAVVVPGSRPVRRGEFAKTEGLSMQCALIVKYRDQGTDRATALEQALR